MRNREYWTKRFEQLEDAQLNKGAAYFSELENHYTRAAREVQKEINQWYARFAVNNEITLQEARKILRADELKEFKWSVKEYIKHGEENNISGQWAKQLENASARWHITRLDALKLQMQNHIEMLYGYEQDSVTRLMEQIYSDGYYHTAFELQKGFNIGYDLMKLDTRQIEKVISKPWAADGSNFSSRIWKQKTQLVSELHTELTQAIIRGQNPGKITDYIAHRFGVSNGRAGALVMTEAAFFASAPTKDCFNDLGVKLYEICATLDKITSEKCRGLDGHVFKMSEYEVGVTAPPFHPWCRTTTVPYFDDEFELDTKRAARGEDGKTYYVPADMKYPEWKKAFVDGGSKKDLKLAKDEPTFMQKKETIYNNEQQIDKLFNQKKEEELKMLTSSSLSDMEAAQKNAQSISKKIDELKAENDRLQQSLGVPTNAKERFHSQSLDYETLPHDVREDELSAVGAWTRTDYTFINDYLRNGNKGVRPESIENANTLQKMIDRNIVQEPFTVKRGTDFNAMNHLFGSDNWTKKEYNVAGKVIVDKGFVATTPDLHGGFGGGIQMYIDVPKGAKGVYLGDLSAAPDEKEFLLQCGTRFAVEKIESYADKFGDLQYDVFMRVIVDE